MPKLRHFARHSGIPLADVWKFALLNEFIIFTLTGHVYGDTTNQGMSGFFHIARRCWSQEALHYAGIEPGQLADVAPAARLARPLSPTWQARLELDAVNVYSCGNDQSCSAAGAGLTSAGDILCNFGTAMVVYALKDELPATLLDKQIAGISPYTGRYFLLGLESECGNVLDWAHRALYAHEPFSTMMSQALLIPAHLNSLPRITFPGAGRIQIDELTVGHERWQIVRALLERYGEIFGELLAGVRAEQAIHHLFASGGVSRSDAWLQTLSDRFAVQFERTTTEQPGLVGVARIIHRSSLP
jgi:sugar (pentulose or hexulose) kinase